MTSSTLSDCNPDQCYWTHNGAGTSGSLNSCLWVLLAAMIAEPSSKMFLPLNSQVVEQSVRADWKQIITGSKQITYAEQYSKYTKSVLWYSKHEEDSIEVQRLQSKNIELSP